MKQPISKIIFSSLLFILLYSPALARVTEIMECKGSSPYERYEVTATCDTFTNAYSKTIHLYEVWIDPQLSTFNKGDAVQITGRRTQIEPQQSKKLATNFKEGDSSFGINVYYVAITRGGEQHWYGTKQVCIDLNLKKDHINPANEDDYYTKDNRCDRDDLQLAITGSFTFTNSNKKDFKKYTTVSGGGGTEQGPSRIEKFKQRQIEKKKQIAEREEKIKACARVQSQLNKDISVIDYASIEDDIKLCSKKLTKALEEAQLADEKLNLLISNFRKNLQEEHAPEVRERLDLLDVKDVETSRRELGLNYLYMSNSYEQFDNSSYGFYTTVANSYVDDFLKGFVNFRDEPSFRVSELSFSETFGFYPSDFSENMESHSKLNYIDGVIDVKSYLTTIGSISAVDEYGYQIDSPVPTEIRETVRNDIIKSPEFTSAGVELEEALQSLEGQLTDKQKKSFVVLQAITFVIKNAHEDALKMSDTINETLRVISKKITNTLCESTAFIPVINDGRDAYEALSGADACTGEVLDWKSRLLSAAGVFYGNGAVLRKMSGSGIPISKIDDLNVDLQKIEDSAKSFGAKSTRGIKAYAKRTKPTKPRGSQPRGNFEPETGSVENIRSIKRQNESASELADEGFDVEMIPNNAGGGIQAGTSPDFNIAGKRFDAYSPKDAGLSGISRKIESKTTRQAERIVLNLDDSPHKVADVVEHLKNYPNNTKNLDELIIIKDGKVEQYFPF